MASSQFPIITKYSSLKTYKENYQKDLEVYLEDYEENKEIDYLEKDLFAYNHLLEHLQTKEIEIEELEEPKVNETIEKRNTRNEIRRDLHELSNTINERKINSLKRIIEFIEQRIAELGTEMIIITEPEPFDLSNTTAVKKIIYLNELGIIDFLKTKPEFIGSTNLMATFLSAITDVKASTLQTGLNKLVINDTDDQRHPYYSNNTVNEVRQTLIDKNVKPKTS